MLSVPRTAYAASLDMSATQNILKNEARLSTVIASNKNYKYTVYEMFDEDGNVKYVGRTRQDIEKRKKQHWKKDINKDGLDIRPAEINGTKLENLSYKEPHKMSSTGFESNAVKLQLAMLAYNFNNWFRRLCLPEAFKPGRIETLRTKLIKIAGKLVYSGRYWTWKLQLLHLQRAVHPNTEQYPTLA